jgi:cell division protein FtsB
VTPPKPRTGAATQLGRDAEMIDALVAEIDALNREVVEVTARNVVLREEQARLEARHNADRAHIRDLIAELVRRDFR